MFYTVQFKEHDVCFDDASPCFPWHFAGTPTMSVGSTGRESYDLPDMSQDDGDFFDPDYIYKPEQ